MKKSRILLMVSAIVFCAAVSACMFYAISVHISRWKECVDGIGWLGFGLIALLFAVGAFGYGYLAYGAIRLLRKEYKTGKLRSAESEGGNDFE